jgi:hypothetical protein
MENRKNQSKKIKQNIKKKQPFDRDSNLDIKKNEKDWYDWAFSPIETNIDLKKEQRLNKPDIFPKKTIFGRRFIKKE